MHLFLQVQQLFIEDRVGFFYAFLNHFELCFHHFTELTVLSLDFVIQGLKLFGKGFFVEFYLFLYLFGFLFCFLELTLDAWDSVDFFQSLFGLRENLLNRRRQNLQDLVLEFLDSLLE